MNEANTNPIRRREWLGLVSIMANLISVGVGVALACILHFTELEN
jgi:hypothetical protein